MLCNKHLCLALKPYLDRELRNGRGVIKKDADRFSRAAFDYISYLEELISTNIDADVIANEQCQLLKKTIRNDKKKKNVNIASNEVLSQTTSVVNESRKRRSRDTSIDGSPVVIQKKTRYSLRSNPNYLDEDEVEEKKIEEATQEEKIDENKDEGQKISFRLEEKMIEYETREQLEEYELPKTEKLNGQNLISFGTINEPQDNRISLNNNNFLNTTVNEMLDLVTEVIQNEISSPDYLSNNAELESPASPPSYSSSTTVTTKIIALEQVAQNQEIDVNNYEKIYNELFSVCDQRN